MKLSLFVLSLLVLPLVPPSGLAIGTGCASNVTEIALSTSLAYYVYADQSALVEIWSESNGLHPHGSGVFSGAAARLDLQRGDACDNAQEIEQHGADTNVF